MASRVHKTCYNYNEISLIQLIRISTTDLVFCLTDLIHWGFLDAFYLQI
jgi:hypothetical protein